MWNHGSTPCPQALCSACGAWTLLTIRWQKGSSASCCLICFCWAVLPCPDHVLRQRWAAGYPPFLTCQVQVVGQNLQLLSLPCVSLLDRLVHHNPLALGCWLSVNFSCGSNAFLAGCSQWDPMVPLGGWGADPFLCWQRGHTVWSGASVLMLVLGTSVLLKAVIFIFPLSCNSSFLSLKILYVKLPSAPRALVSDRGVCISFHLFNSPDACRHWTR